MGLQRVRHDSSAHTHTVARIGSQLQHVGSLLGHAGSFAAVLYSLAAALRFNYSKACGILVPRPGIEPVSPALEVLSSPCFACVSLLVQALPSHFLTENTEA